MQHGADRPAAHHQPWSGPLGPGWWSTWASCPQKPPDKQKSLFGSCPSLPSLSDHRTESGCNYTHLWERSISIALPRITTLRKAHLNRAWQSTLNNGNGSWGTHISSSNHSKFCFGLVHFVPHCLLWEARIKWDCEGAFFLLQKKNSKI